MYKTKKTVKTLNRGEKMKQRKVKKEALITTITLGIIAVVSILLSATITLEKEPSKNDNENVNKTIFENNIPVIGTPEIILRPYTDSSIKIATNYYNQKDDEETQKNSLILYENTYLPSTGIDYQSDYDFDVVSILDGIVVTVKEDQTLGKLVEIKHKNNLMSSYQSLSEIMVKEGDEVKQGTIIGKSGTSNLQKNMGSHLHFELIKDSETVDPEEYYDKELGNL